MARKVRKSDSELLVDLMRIHVPEDYLKYFELFEVKKKSNCSELILDEKPTLIPDALKDNQVVLDGFTYPVSILTHTFFLRKMYLVIYRRRWKAKGTKQYLYNTYDLHPDSIKITPEYAAFLKEYDRMPTYKY